MYDPHHRVIIVSLDHKIWALFDFRKNGNRSIQICGKRCSNLGNFLSGSTGSAVDDIPINCLIHTLFGLRDRCETSEFGN